MIPAKEKGLKAMQGRGSKLSRGGAQSHAGEGLKAMQGRGLKAMQGRAQSHSGEGLKVMQGRGSKSCRGGAISWETNLHTIWSRKPW